MTEQQIRNKNLIEKYPFLKWWGDPLYMNYKEEGEPSYDYTWEDEVPAGWRKAFCPLMWDELKDILQKANYVEKFRFAQIKEKYGTLRLYDEGVPNEIFDEVLAWTQKYEDLSAKTCIHCGADHVDYMTTGWITFICKECAQEIAKNQLKKFGNCDHFVPMKDIDLFYDDRDAYWEKHKNDDILKD